MRPFRRHCEGSLLPAALLLDGGRTAVEQIPFQPLGLGAGLPFGLEGAGNCSSASISGLWAAVLGLLVRKN